MDNKKIDLDRRQFFKVGLMSVVSLVVLPALDRKGLSWTARADGAKLPDLSEKDPMAVSLGYLKNAKKADPKQYPMLAQGASCKTCMFFTDVGGKKGKCQIFVGKLVQSGGLCKSWSKKPA